jgi:Tfp pilus assembly PilM family ATPase
VAIAHRLTIERLLDAVEAAGLRIAAVDVVPLALIRSLGREAQAQGQAEAIVSFGAGTTSIVVHQSGIPVLIETLPRGGRRLTDLLVSEVGTLEVAEAEKRRVGVFPEPQLVAVGRQTQQRSVPAPVPEPTGPWEELAAATNQPADAGPGVEGADVGSAHDSTLSDEAIRELLEPGVQDLLSEVSGVFDALLAFPEAAQLHRVVVTGGGSLLPGLDRRLEQALGLPVVVAKPRLGLDIADIGFAPEDYPRLDPYLGVPLGIAAGGLTSQRRINLMPPPPVVVRPSRAAVLLAVLLMLLLISGMVVSTVVRQAQRAQAEGVLRDQLTENQILQRQVDNYADLAGEAAETDAVRQQVLIQLSYDVGWSRIMQELAVTTPSDTFLTSFRGVSTAPGSTATGVPPLAPGTTVQAGAPTGGVTVTGAGAGFPSVAAWLQRSTEVNALANVWITNATRVPTSSGDIVLFTAAGNLTPGAQSNRLANEQGQAEVAPR